MIFENGTTHPQDLFAALVEEHGGRLFRLAYLLLQDAAAAEDAVQDCFLKMWTHIDRVRTFDRLEGWLTRVLVNICRDEARRMQRRARVNQLLGRPQSVPDASGRLAQADELQSALRRLSHAHREVIVLRYYLDLSAESIAHAVLVPEGTVRSRLHHALRALRTALEAEGEVS